MKTKSLNSMQLRSIILEELDDIISHEQAEEVEAREEAWSGGDNLALSIDYAKAVGAEETTTSPETLSIKDDRGVYRMSESHLRSMVRKIIQTS